MLSPLRTTITDDLKDLKDLFDLDQQTWSGVSGFYGDCSPDLQAAKRNGKWNSPGMFGKIFLSLLCLKEEGNEEAIRLRWIKGHLPLNPVFERTKDGEYKALTRVFLSRLSIRRENNSLVTEQQWKRVCTFLSDQLPVTSVSNQFCFKILQITHTDHIASCNEPISHTSSYLTERQKETSIFSSVAESTNNVI